MTSIATKPTTVGLTVEDSTNHEHVTLFYPREISVETYGIMLQDITLALDKINTAVYVKIYSVDNFGPKKDIPVYRVKFQNKTYEKQFIKLWKKYDDSDERRNGLYEPEWHITIKKGSSLTFDENATEQQPLIRLNYLFLKHLGPCDPYYRILIPCE